jgi:hypothetical protein
MRNHLVHVAVAAAIAGTASLTANATSYTINISGASAQRTLWESDLEAIATGAFGSTTDAGGTTECFLTKTSPTLTPAVPDLHTLVCTISGDRFATGPTTPGTLAAGDVVTMYYGAEFGSVWGIAPFVPGSTASTRGRSVLTPLAGGGTQTVSGYSRDLDTASAGLSAPILVDIGVSDNEPVLWALPDNWAYSDGLSNSGPDGTGTNNVINVLSIPGQGQPTLAQLQTLEQQWTFVNGEVFSFVVGNSATPTNALTNLSTQSLRSIFTGQYTTWNQVPEVGALVNNGTLTAAAADVNIVVCRRDHGSGTEVTTSKYLTLTESGGNNGYNGTGTAVGGAPRIVSLNTNPAGGLSNNLATSAGTIDTFTENPIENYSSNDVKSCLTSNSGISIGILVLSPAGSYTTLNVDGIQANIHNSAFGMYQFFAEDWAYNGTATTQSGNSTAQAIASKLFTDVSKNTGVLANEGGSWTGGQWSVGANTAQTYFYLQDGLNVAKPVASSSSELANPSTPTAVWTNSKKSACTILTNDNH